MGHGRVHQSEDSMHDAQSICSASVALRRCPGSPGRGLQAAGRGPKAAVSRTARMRLDRCGCVVLAGLGVELVAAGWATTSRSRKATGPIGTKRWPSASHASHAACLSPYLPPCLRAWCRSGRAPCPLPSPRMRLIRPGHAGQRPGHRRLVFFSRSRCRPSSQAPGGARALASLTLHGFVMPRPSPPLLPPPAG